MVQRIWHGWHARRAGVVVAGTAIAVAAALATRSLGAPSAAMVLIAAIGGSLAVLLLLVDRSEARQLARESSLRRIRQYGERLAIYDRETGLYAYWYFSLRLEEEMERARRYSQPLALILIESTAGRLAPDDEEHLFSALIETFRTSDIVAHLGNLRFVALLTNTNASGASVAVQRLGRAIAPHDAHIGMSAYPSDGDEWESLLRRAGASTDAIDDARHDIASVRRRELRLAEEPASAAR